MNNKYMWGCQSFCGIKTAQRMLLVNLFVKFDRNNLQRYQTYDKNHKIKLSVQKYSSPKKTDSLDEKKNCRTNEWFYMSWYFCVSAITLGFWYHRVTGTCNGETSSIIIMIRNKYDEYIFASAVHRDLQWWSVYNAHNAANLLLQIISVMVWHFSWPKPHTHSCLIIHPTKSG